MPSLKTISEKKQDSIKHKITLLKEKSKLEHETLELKVKQEELRLREQLAKEEEEDRHVDEDYNYDYRELGSQKTHRSHGSDLLSVVRHLNKPTAELQKFSGDPMQYQRFIRQFKTRIVDFCDDYDEKLTYLEQYTSGDAKKIVMGYSYMSAKKGYLAAMKELED